MLRSLRTSTRRRAVLLASGTVVLLAIGGGTTAAFAASSDGSTPTATPTSGTCAVHLRAELLGAVPQQLKTDLKTLRSEPKGAQRAAERKAIATKALAGGYGDQVERVAHVVAGRKGTVKSVLASLPAPLKADLKTLRATTPKSTARKAEAVKIEQKALARGYGTTVQQRAKTVQAKFQELCSADAAK